MSVTRLYAWPVSLCLKWLLADRGWVFIPLTVSVVRLVEVDHRGSKWLLAARSASPIQCVFSAWSWKSRGICADVEYDVAFEDLHSPPRPADGHVDGPLESARDTDRLSVRPSTSFRGVLWVQMVSGLGAGRLGGGLAAATRVTPLCPVAGGTLCHGPAPLPKLESGRAGWACD